MILSQHILKGCVQHSYCYDEIIIHLNHYLEIVFKNLDVIK